MESAPTRSEPLARPRPSRTIPDSARALARAVLLAALRHAFTLGVAGCTAAVAAVVLARLTAWPPHEDETLALFVGRGSMRDILQIVLGERGGAPLHFLLAFAVAHSGGGLVALRLVSALFAVASVPVIAALGARLADRTTGLVATALASGSWVLLFHAVYGRMYSLFLFTSALSYLALLQALEHGGRRRFVFWGVAAVLTVASHPYGALVLGSQAAYVLLRRVRLREAVKAGLAVAIVCVPFWRADLVLAGRFDVGVGGGGDKLGAPLPVARYLATVAGDFSAGYVFVLPVVLVLAALGLWRLVRTRPASALLVAAVIATPTLAFLVARLGSSTSPESRHLIFALPFFSTILAAALVFLARRPLARAPWLVAAAVLALVGGEVAWAAHKTRPLFAGEPRARVEAREAASAWLARTSEPSDILFGYDPLFLGAWERNRQVPDTVIPRADSRLALQTLDALRKPLGRGVWVLDASDTNNFAPKLTIPLVYPHPASAFEVRVFGPFLVVRSRERTLTTQRYLLQTLQVMAVGQTLLIGDADINLLTARQAARRYGVLGGRR
jgi:hypothetical protein